MCVCVCVCMCKQQKCDNVREVFAISWKSGRNIL